MFNISLLTYGLAAAGFSFLCLLLLARWQWHPLNAGLVAAIAASAGWAGVIALGTLAEYPPVTAIRCLETLRNLGWLFFLLQLSALQRNGRLWQLGRLQWPRLFAPAALLALGMAGVGPWLDRLPAALAATHAELLLTLSLLLAIGTLLAVEQLYRNAGLSERWSLKFLCLGIGALAAYDFFMYAEALLFRQLNAELWQARGLVAALVTPWLAVAIARNRDWQIDLHISRQVVFHGVTLLGAGIYLLAMAVAGYFIKYLGGSWSGVLQIGFLAGSGALLLSLLFSGRLRAQLRVFLSKHFFSYRYDYREEWLKVTAALADLGDEVPEGMVRTLAPLASSPGGHLWVDDGQGAYQLTASWHAAPLNPAAPGLGALPVWLVRTQWVVDLHEYRRSPDLYEGLELPDWLVADDTLWLAIPLLFQERVVGILVLRNSGLKSALNWEDRDLLKTAGRQAGSHLAQHLASRALVEARQFDAFNRLSAYVVHDLKNILAQQSLIVSNAARHRDNPAFIDDMIATVANSVQRMQRLMEQMRSGLRSGAAARVELASLLREVVAARGSSRPVPTLALVDSGNGLQEYWVEADRERLATVFTHLVQNAQEATPADGEVSLQVVAAAGDSICVSIRDTGCGMDEAFVRERLFRPFDSTKGLTGMGIGAFESREYVRQIGGELEVHSSPGEGSEFRVKLPLGTQNADDPVDAAAVAADNPVA